MKKFLKSLLKKQEEQNFALEWKCWSGEISAEAETLEYSGGPGRLPHARVDAICVYENVFGATYVVNTRENRAVISEMARRGLGGNGVNWSEKQVEVGFINAHQGITL